MPKRSIALLFLLAVVVVSGCKDRVATTSSKCRPLRTPARTPSDTSLHGLFLAPDGSRVGVITHDLTLYDMVSGEPTKVFPHAEYGLFSPDSRLLAYVAVNQLKRTLHVYDLTADLDIYDCAGEEYSLSPCVFTPDSKFLLHHGVELESSLVTLHSFLSDIRVYDLR